jgi:ribosomal protein S21
MDVRRATDLLCRSYASLSLSTTSNPSRAVISPRSTISRALRNSSTCQSCRPFSSQTVLRQQAAARKPDSDSDTGYSTPSPSSNVRDIYKSRQTFLGERKPSASATRSSTPNSFRPPPPRSATSANQRTTSPGRTSIDDFLDEAQNLNRPRGMSHRGTGSDQLPATFARKRNPFPVPSTDSRYNAYEMAFPEGTDLKPAAPKPRVITELDIHVKPRTGRTVAVDPGKPNDLGAKLRSLDMLCARNRIKADFNQQKFHERPGLKRKRLASQRWRRNFKARFNGVVKRVNDLRVQGW